MRDFFKKNRKRYFTDIAKKIPAFKGQFVVIAHIVPDMPEVLEAINKISPISLIIAIPYSLDMSTYNSLKDKYKIIDLSLEQLLDSEVLCQVVGNQIDSEKPAILIEVGGYFSNITHKLQKVLDGKLLGVIEDTEAGHRRYLNSTNLSCPVVSMARSLLKEKEDFLVGSSCLHSFERLLRKLGHPTQNKDVLVVGFGKIGKGLAYALRQQNYSVRVYDIDPAKRVQALVEGFKVPEKAAAFQQAHIIFGATGTCSVTGQDFNLLPHGAILVSCSSKKVEFDLDYLERNFKKQQIISNLDLYVGRNNKSIYLAAEGQPINFAIDKSLVGPVMALIQAEILLGVRMLIQGSLSSSVVEVSVTDQLALAEKWLEYFCDNSTGCYKSTDAVPVITLMKQLNEAYA
ncbi:MAG: adenosylhomocysteinase [Gammaproteobacteria bacterium]|nr:adenosylhomocysteinase [Gammaproteobacteria bacterium]